MTFLFRFITIFCISVVSFSQSIVVIDINKKTLPLFDDNQPLSLISMLKSGLYNLGSFDLAGMSDSLANSLSQEEKLTALKFAPMFHDYEYNENGEPRTVFNEETGLNDYVFILPDTTYSSLDNIERLVFNIKPGSLSNLPGIESVEFWKRYNGKLQKVLSLNPAILKLQGFKTIRPVNSQLQSFWLDKQDSLSLWNQMRMASLKMKSNFEKGIVDEEDNGFVMDFFPYSSFFPFDAYFGENPEIVDDQLLNEINSLVILDKDFNTNLPFQFTYGDTIFSQDGFNDKLRSEFNEIAYVTLESDYPMIDQDPDSPNFMSELMIENSEGENEFVYADPDIFYMWCDYNNVELFAIEEFVYDGNFEQMLTKIVGLCFTKTMKDGKPEIISYMQTDGGFREFFKEYPSDKLNELEWNEILQQEIEKSTNTYMLNDPKDVKRFDKRNKKLK